jgi:spore germination protein KC
MRLKGKFHRLVSVLLILPLFLNLSGCWSYRELNNYSFLVALGVDKGKAPGTFMLIEQLAIPSNMKAGGGQSGGGGADSAFWNVESEGETVFSTVRDLTRKVQRKPFYGHNSILLFGREIAEEGIFKYIDFIVRDTEPRISTLMVVAKDKAAEILAQKPHLEKTTASKIEKALEGHIFSSYFQQIQVKDFVEDMLAENKAAVVPIVELVDLEVTEEKGGGGKGGGKGQTDSQSGSQSPDKGQKSEASQNRVLVINRSAVFKQYKMVGDLDNIQSRGFCFATNKASGGIIVIDSPDGKGKIEIEFNKVKAKIKPVLKGDKPSIIIEVKMLGGIAAQESEKNNATPEKLKKISEKVNEAVKNEIMSSVNKAKEIDADIFGFGNEIYRKNPKVWKKLKKNWDEELKKLDVKVKVETKLGGTASIRSIAKMGEAKYQVLSSSF